jgi:cytochrome c biogenesis protein CcmG/thiol:disulfide interchange protein DsbE
MLKIEKKIWIELVCLSLLLCILGSCKPQIGSRSTSGPATPSSSTEPAAEPSAYGWTLDNDQHAGLADLKGKVVVLDFYATWCEPCRAETPRLVAMQQRYGNQGLQVIGLNVGGEDDRAQVPDYAKEFSIPYPLGFPEDEFADQYLGDNQSIPQVFVFDRQGRMVKRFVGYTEDAPQELEHVVQVSLAK